MYLLLTFPIFESLSESASSAMLPSVHLGSWSVIFGDAVFGFTEVDSIFLRGFGLSSTEESSLLDCSVVESLNRLDIAS